MKDTMTHCNQTTFNSNEYRIFLCGRDDDRRMEERRSSVYKYSIIMHINNVQKFMKISIVKIKDAKIYNLIRR